MVDQAINGGDRHHGVGKNLIPLTKGLIGGDHQAPSFIAMGNQLKQDGGLHVGLFDIPQIINDQEIVAVEFDQ